MSGKYTNLCQYFLTVFEKCYTDLFAVHINMDISPQSQIC